MGQIALVINVGTVEWATRRLKEGRKVLYQALTLVVIDN
jgi:hypothetical protein